MPLVARIGDLNTNHPPCNPGHAMTGSPSVFANNIPVHRVSDVNIPHPIPMPICIDHGGTSLITGSPNVYANNLKLGRIGDSYDCGILVDAGSPNVMANS